LIYFEQKTIEVVIRAALHNGAPDGEALLSHEHALQNRASGGANFHPAHPIRLQRGGSVAQH
jgi:hypothetical protein